MSYSAETRYLHKDGHLVYVLLSVSLAHDAEAARAAGSGRSSTSPSAGAPSERGADRRSAAEAEAVADTIQKIQRVTDAALEHLAMDDLLRELATHIADILQVDSAAIFLRAQGEEHLTVGAIVGLGEENEPNLQIPMGETFAGRVAEGREPVVVEDAAGALQDPLLHGHGRARDARRATDRRGARERRDPGRDRVRTVASRARTESLLQLVADRAALAVEHARLYERELGIVETLQRSLLPDSLPQVPGLLTAARYMPGGPGADVGGDWYDAVSLDGGRLGIAMGDVVGHGIGAAALMGQLRNALRAYALDGNSPAQVVEKLDRLVQNLEAGRMATLVYMVIAPDLGSVEFSSAGHLPPLVLGPDGTASYLEGGRTLPLGVCLRPSTRRPTPSSSRARRSSSTRTGSSRSAARRSTVASTR